jgi:aminopeptidase-like protein
MANNELSGPAVATYLAKWLMAEPRRYSYRIVFVPETIGSITYLNKNIIAMKKNIIAGFNVSCVGDERTYSYLPSRNGNTLADKVAMNVLKFKYPEFKKYSYLDRGSDERQYCSPGVDLPVASIMRSKYGQYPEYHTSMDDLRLVTPDGLYGAYDVLRHCIEVLEANYKYAVRCLGEPQLGKRGLYPTISTKTSSKEVKSMMNFLAYCDGTNDLMDISNIINVPVWNLYEMIEKLKKAKLIK